MIIIIYLFKYNGSLQSTYDFASLTYGGETIPFVIANCVMRSRADWLRALLSGGIDLVTLHFLMATSWMSTPPFTREISPFEVHNLPGESKPLKNNSRVMIA